MCLRCSTPPGYATVDSVRPSDPEHGEIVIIHSAALVASPLPVPPTATFEYICLQLSSEERSVVLLSIYIPGSQRATGVFFEELATVQSVLITLRRPVVAGGDITIHVDDHGDHEAVKLADLLLTYDPVQHVTKPTRARSHSRPCDHRL